MIGKSPAFFSNHWKLFAAALLLAVPAASARTLYVWTNSPGSAAPFTNWATAAHTIQEAVDEAYADDLILVTNGTYDRGGTALAGYTLTNRVLLDHRLTVRSVNGPGVTTIKGQGPIGPAAVRGVLLNSVGASLSGFTIRDGCTREDGAGIGEFDKSGAGASLRAAGVISNCTFTGNQASLYGGGADAFASGCRVVDCLFLENGALYAGGGARLMGAEFLNCYLGLNRAGEDGGGVYAQAGSRLWSCTNVLNVASNHGGALHLASSFASNLVLMGNVAAEGGGAYIGGCTGFNLNVWANQASERGGGVSMWRGELRDSIVSNNDLNASLPSATWKRGAGVNMELSTLSGCLITGNRSVDGTEFGGGVYGRSTNVISNCIIRDNTAGSGGGIGMAYFGDRVRVESDSDVYKVTGNTASNIGGGVYAGTQTVFEARGVSIFSANYAPSGGGLGAVAGAQVDIRGDSPSDMLFYDNVAYRAGGGIFASGTATRLYLENVQLGRYAGKTQGNTALGAGGGGAVALFNGASLTGVNLRVEYNESKNESGGGIYVERASLDVSSQNSPGWPTALPATIFALNSATGYNGGAVYAFVSHVRIRDAAFLANRADRGGAIHLDNSTTGLLVNLVVAVNTASQFGAGLRPNAPNTRVDIRHCTIVGNRTGGVEAASGAVFTLTNCIVRDHAGTNVTPGFAVGYSDIQGGYGGPGNIDANPYFRNAANLDYRLTMDSTNSVADAGANAGVTNDCVMRARWLGNGYDMGSFEYNPDRDDYDGDGMADGWEAENGLNPRSAADGSVDSDQDGVTNNQEYASDTDPLDSNRYFRLEYCYRNPARPDRGIQVGYTSSADRVYSLYATEALAGGAWTPMPGLTNIPGVNGPDGLDDTNDLPHRAYRVIVAVPPG